ncbi:homoserine dehydrogenase, partial [Sulfolobus sp. F1]
MKLLLVGYGNVGRAFRKLLYEKKDRYPILQDVEIAGIVTRRGFMMGDKDDFIPEKTINVIEALDFVNP